MSCAKTFSGLAKDCLPNVGGIKAAWIANHADVSALTVADGKVSAITMVQPASGTAPKFKKYYFRPSTSNFESTLNTSEENGPQDVSTLINLVFGRMETTKRIEVEAMSLGELALIVLDANDVYWYFGFDNPVFASAGTGSTGAARSDRNGYSVTLQDNAKSWPYEILASAITTDVVDEI